MRKCPKWTHNRKTLQKPETIAAVSKPINQPNHPAYPCLHITDIPELCQPPTQVFSAWFIEHCQLTLINHNDKFCLKNKDVFMLFSKSTLKNTDMSISNPELVSKYSLYKLEFFIILLITVVTESLSQV